MFNTVFGWYARQNLSCKFDTIVFAESVAANTTGYTVTLANAQDGADKKERLSGSNFIITGIYSVCTTGVVDVKVLPDNDTTAKFYLQLYQPISKNLPVPLLLMSDLVIVFDNNEAHINNAYLAFDGFWIAEEKMPAFTLLSETIPMTLGNIDIQTLAIEKVLAAMAESEGVAVPEYEGPEYKRPPSTFREFCKKGGRF